MLLVGVLEDVPSVSGKWILIPSMLEKSIDVDAIGTDSVFGLFVEVKAGWRLSEVDDEACCCCMFNIFGVKIDVAILIPSKSDNTGRGIQAVSSMFRPMFGLFIGTGVLAAVI